MSMGIETWRRVARGLLVIVVAVSSMGDVIAQEAAGQPVSNDGGNVACPSGLDLERILIAHGLVGLESVRQIDFTFHARTPDGEIVREWHWDRVRGEVTLTTSPEDGPRQMLAFSSPPSTDAPESILQADRWFTNDSYWLLFPLQLSWEQGIVVTAECTPQPLPLGGGEAPRFTVVYTGSGGYTPGDAYDFYPEPSGLIAQWVYRRGNVAEATLAVAFGDYTEVGPLTLSLTRLGADGAPRVWFTDVSLNTVAMEYRVTPDSGE